jgi:tRNA(fMet)-specific endonuclease VapC
LRILDTDTCVEILHGNTAVIAARRAQPDLVVTTWITAGELFYGAAKSISPGTNLPLVREFLATLETFGLDPQATERFGLMKTELERGGQRLADADLLIAAIALAKNAVLVTGNARHYSRIPGLQLEDWIRPAVP